MKPRIPFWFAPKENGEPQTVEQLEALLKAADNDIALAQGLEAAARAKEATERSVPAVEATEAAMAETARLRRFREALVADLEAAKERAREAELIRLRGRKLELEKQLAHGALVEAAAPLVAQELEALKAVARVRVERRRLHAEKSKLAHELYTARVKLGEKPPLPTNGDPVSEIISAAPVAEAIDACRREVGEEVFGYLGEMRPDEYAYHPGRRGMYEMTAMLNAASEAQRAANR